MPQDEYEEKWDEETEEAENDVAGAATNEWRFLKAIQIKKGTYSIPWLFALQYYFVSSLVFATQKIHHSSNDNHSSQIFHSFDSPKLTKFCFQDGCLSDRGLSMSFLTVQAIRFAISGILPNQEGASVAGNSWVRKAF